jgi:hypothetical protein
MKKHTGGISTLTLSYDMTFFALARLALTGEVCTAKRAVCAAHPLQKRLIANDCPQLEYSARVGALLAYFKCRDDAADEKGVKRLFFRMALPYARKMKKRASLPEAEKYVSECISELCRLESEKCPEPDAPADSFGRLLGGLLSMGLDEKKSLIARAIGFHTGRWVYLADAAADYSEDRLGGKYNPFVYAFDDRKEADEFLSERIWEILTLELCEIEKAVALIDFTDEGSFGQMIKACMENTIHGGMKNAFSLAAKRRRGNEKRSV